MGARVSRWALHSQLAPSTGGLAKTRGRGQLQALHPAAPVWEPVQGAFVGLLLCGRGLALQGTQDELQAPVFVSRGELYIGHCPPCPGSCGSSTLTAGPPSPSSRTSTRRREAAAMPHGRVAQTASSLLWGPAAGRLKAVWGLRAWHHPRLGPALAEGHLIEPSTRWLLPTLDRGHRQLDLTQGAPLLPRLRPEPQLTEPASARGQGSAWCLWPAGGPEALPLARLPPRPAPRPAPCCKLLLGFRVLPPAPNTSLTAESPLPPRGRSCPSFLGPSCPGPEASPSLWFHMMGPGARRLCGESLGRAPRSLSRWAAPG